MTQTETDALREELLRFQTEQEQIRRVLGQVGGSRSARRDRTVTIVFIVAISALFVVDMCRHVLGFTVPLPRLFSLQLGVLLVSLKIVWMMRNQSRVEHFQFWMLNSIEFRLTSLTKTIQSIEDRLGEEEREGMKSNL